MNRGHGLRWGLAEVVRVSVSSFGAALVRGGGADRRRAPRLNDRGVILSKTPLCICTGEPAGEPSESGSVSATSASRADASLSPHPSSPPHNSPSLPEEHLPWSLSRLDDAPPLRSMSRSTVRRNALFVAASVSAPSPHRATFVFAPWSLLQAVLVSLPSLLLLLNLLCLILSCAAEHKTAASNVDSLTPCSVIWLPVFGSLHR
mmetsp:Transcript_5604/g.18462  ORF Transcript_5604/g.18462 Transcript_5604/m.18462 type:complete len:204 (-) Transcript_5604:891-1502(-)